MKRKAGINTGENALTTPFLSVNKNSSLWRPQQANALFYPLFHYFRNGSSF